MYYQCATINIFASLCNIRCNSHIIFQISYNIIIKYQSPTFPFYNSYISLNNTINAYILKLILK